MFSLELEHTMLILLIAVYGSSLWVEFVFMFILSQFSIIGFPGI